MKNGSGILLAVPSPPKSGIIPGWELIDSHHPLQNRDSLGAMMSFNFRGSTYSQ